jgi:hypothetical protein
MTNPRIDSTTMLDENNNAADLGEVISLDPEPAKAAPAPSPVQKAPAPAARPEPAPEQTGPTPEQEAEAGELVVQVGLGIEYTDTFTLRDALKSYNGTKRDIRHPETGELLLSAKAQHAVMPESWLKKREGKFKLRRPSFHDLMAMRCRIAEFTRGLDVDPDTTEMLTGMSVCEQLLVDAPAWFDVAKEKNGDVVRLILHWHRQWGDTFREED